MNIIPELNLNKHPKDVKNNSLVAAENVMISNDSSLLQTENNFVNATQNVLGDDVIAQSGQIHILYVLPCNKELLLFNLSIHNNIDIIRYNEELHKSKIVLRNISYHNGKLIGAFTYNKGNLIIAISEYFENNKNNIPLKTFNLGKFEDTLTYDVAMSTYKHSLVPQIKIPTLTSNYNTGLAYKGWYYVFIRYKIDEYNYTHWFNTNHYLLVDSFENNNIIDYKLSEDVYKEIYGSGSTANFSSTIKTSQNISKDIDVSTISFDLDLDNLDNRYKYYQLGFICINKTLSKAFCTSDIDISNNKFNFNNSIVNNISINELTEDFYNYYNVKSLDVINNRLYIGNYNTKNKELTNFTDFSVYIEPVYTIHETTNKTSIKQYTATLENDNKDRITSFNFNSNQIYSDGDYNYISGRYFIFRDENGNDEVLNLPNELIVAIYIPNPLNSTIEDISINELVYNIDEKKYKINSDELNTSLDNIKILIPIGGELKQFTLVNHKYEWSSVDKQVEINNPIDLLSTVSVYPGQYYKLFIVFIDEYGELSKPILIHKDNIKGSNIIIYNNNLIKVNKIKDNITLLNIKLNSEIPDGYIGYFIGYSKFKNTIKHRGFIEKINDEYYFYSNSLNYSDSINLDFNKILIYNKDNTKTNDNNQELINASYGGFKQFSIKSKEVLAADSLNNLLKSTCIKLEINVPENPSLNLDGYNYVELINDDINQLYENDNEIIIPATPISYNIKDTLVFNPKNAFFGDINALIMKNTYFDFATNTYRNINKSEAPQITNVHIKEFIEVPEETLVLHNLPQQIYFPKNITDNAFKQDYYIGHIVDIKNTIDLFKEVHFKSYENYPKVLINSKNKYTYEFTKTIARSNVIQDESDTNAWRKFKVEEYRNINENKGNIIKLIGIGKYFIVHTEHSMFLFNGTDTIKSEEGNIQLASVDIMNLNYQEVITSKLGYAGLKKEHHGIVGTFGYIFYSADDKRLYRYDNNRLEVIDGTITNFIKKNKFDDAVLIDDKERNRLIIKFINSELKTSAVLSYNYLLNCFVSKHTYNFSQGCSTKIQTYFISEYNNKGSNNIYRFSLKYTNNSTISILINTDYELIKYLDVIKYKINKIDESKDNGKSPVEGKQTYYAANSIQIYSEFCDTGEINIAYTNLSDKTINAVDNYKKPYWRFGNWHFSAIRDKLIDSNKTADEKSRVFGNWFVVKFNTSNQNLIEFETLDCKLSLDEN